MRVLGLGLDGKSESARATVISGEPRKRESADANVVDPPPISSTATPRQAALSGIRHPPFRSAADDAVLLFPAITGARLTSSGSANLSNEAILRSGCRGELRVKVG